MTQKLATLLPDAKVDIFAHDGSTQNVARALESDWRMARVKLRVDQGDIVSAINRYGTEPSPHVIIIETHAIDESFTRHLEHLANVCAQDTAAIFIGPENDIALYRHLLAMGATDYLVRPVTPDDLLNVMGKALLHKVGTSSSRLITVMGSKGGVGTSRITQAMAQCLSDQDEKVTLFDCAGSWGVIGSAYGFDPLITLRDLATTVRTQEHTLDELRHQVTPNLSWLATGGDPLLISTLSSENFEQISDALMRRTPNLVVDLSQSATGIRGMAFAKAHHIVLVTMATPIALKNTRLLIKEIHALRGTDAPIHLVVNQRGILPKEEVRTNDIAQALGIAPAVEVPYLPDVFAKLDTVEGQEFLREMKAILPLVCPLAERITGGKSQGKTLQNPKSSLMQRMLGRR
jgi:pilus assembly protein CpaE